MATTVTYKNNTLVTVNNQTKTLKTAGKFLEDDITLVDISGGTATISVVDTADAAGGNVRTITALDISDTTAVAGDVASGKYFYTAAGVKTAGTASSGGGVILYSLSQETTFNGTSDYIDTNVALMSSTEDDFTIEFTAINGANVEQNAPIFHCMTEQSPYPGLAIQRRSTGDTNYYALAGIVSPQVTLAMPITSGSVMKAVLRRSHSINPSVTTPHYSLWYTVDSVLQTEVSSDSTVTTDKNLLIGCYQQVGGTKGRFWNGTISDFTIRNVAVNDGYVRDYLFNTSN